MKKRYICTRPIGKIKKYRGILLKGHFWLKGLRGGAKKDRKGVGDRKTSERKGRKERK